MPHYILKSHYDNVNSKLTEAEWFFRKEKYEMEGACYLIKEQMKFSKLEHIITTIFLEISEKVPDENVTQIKFNLSGSNNILSQRDFLTKVPEYITVYFTKNGEYITPSIGVILDDLTMNLIAVTLINRLNIDVITKHKYDPTITKFHTFTKDYLGIRIFTE